MPSYLRLSVLFLSIIFAAAACSGRNGAAPDRDRPSEEAAQSGTAAADKAPSQAAEDAPAEKSLGSEAAPAPEDRGEPARPAEGTKAAEGHSPAAAGDHPVVRIETTKGAILIELDNVNAPISTQNFLKYVRTGFYDGTIFHRVMPGFMIQGGGFTEGFYDSYSAQPKTAGPAIKNEARNGLSNLRGTIAMARTNAPNSATSQFFINVVDNQRLDYKSPQDYGYAVFGKVIDGMDVVDEIRNVPTKTWGQHGDVPAEVIKITSASVVKEG